MSEYHSVFFHQLCEIVGLIKSDVYHVKIQKLRIKKDQDVVEANKNCINPFEDCHQMVGLSTVVVASPEIQHGFLLPMQ